MKKCLFIAVMLVAWYAGAQQSPQPKSKDEAAQPESASQTTQAKADHAAQPPADKDPQLSDEKTTAAKNPAPDKDGAKLQTPTPQAEVPVASKGCLAVKPIGSHAFRNVMLFGVTGALISKQQYQVKDVVNYPVSVGTKFHGDDLQTISSSGTKVVILDKRYKEEDIQRACH